MNASDVAVYGALNVVSVTNAATGGIHNTLAPEGTPIASDGTVKPYICFFSLIEIPEYFFAGGPIEDIPYQVDIYAGDPTTTGSIYELVKAVLDDVTMTITSHIFLECTRQNAQRFQEFDHATGKDLFRYMVEYKLAAQKT